MTFIDISNAVIPNISNLASQNATEGLDEERESPLDASFNQDNESEESYSYSG